MQSFSGSSDEIF